MLPDENNGSVITGNICCILLPFVQTRYWGPACAGCWECDVGRRHKVTFLKCQVKRDGVTRQTSSGQGSFRECSEHMHVSVCVLCEESSGVALTTPNWLVWRYWNPKEPATQGSPDGWPGFRISRAKPLLWEYLRYSKGAERRPVWQEGTQSGGRRLRWICRGETGLDRAGPEEVLGLF